MSFFGLFKSKQDRSQDDEFSHLFESIFPGGETDVLRDIERVTIYTHEKIPRDKIRGYVAGCKTLVYVSETEDAEAIVQKFIHRSENLISNAEAYEVFVYFAGEAVYVSNIIRTLGAKGNPLNLGMMQLLAQMKALYANGTYEDRIPGGYGEFGLSVSNPIPMISAKGSSSYLSKLRFRGHPISYVRSGSTSSPVTEGKLDIYKLTVDGEDVGKIYICPYHRRNCRSAPQGFTLIGANQQEKPNQIDRVTEETHKVPAQISQESLNQCRLDAEQNNAEAQLKLGLMYSEGRGVDHNDAEAYRWFLLSAAQGNVLGQFNLGLCYSKRRDIPTDYKKAMEWFRLAADQGNADAQFNLGVMYETGTGRLPKERQGVPIDLEESARWMHMAANQGHVEAQEWLGGMYYTGEGVPQDYEEAVRWGLLAAGQGNAVAQVKLAQMYLYGGKNYEAAVRWLRLAAEQNNGESHDILLAMYCCGLCVPQDSDELAKWTLLAKDKSGGVAQFELANSYYFGLVPDEEEGLMWYRIAAVQGSVEAQVQLKELGIDWKK